MPGNLCSGFPDQQPTVRESKAFCEGLQAATGGALENTNPHPADSVDFTMWAEGWNAYNAGVGAASQTCCADPVYDGVP